MKRKFERTSHKRTTAYDDLKDIDVLTQKLSKRKFIY